MPMLQLRRTMVIAVLTAVAVALPGGGSAAAQGTRATLRGTVRAGGAARPNVTVNVVNLENQNERQAITEADGTWSIAGLLPGRYEVRVDETGFQPYRSAAIALTAGQQQTNDITLQPAAAPPPPPIARPPALPPATQPPAAQPPPTPAARATLRGTVRVGRSTRSNVTVNV